MREKLARILFGSVLILTALLLHPQQARSTERALASNRVVFLSSSSTVQKQCPRKPRHRVSESDRSIPRVRFGVTRTARGYRLRLWASAAADAAEQYTWKVNGKVSSAPRVVVSLKKLRSVTISLVALMKSGCRLDERLTIAPRPLVDPTPAARTPTAVPSPSTQPWPTPTANATGTAIPTSTPTALQPTPTPLQPTPTSTPTPTYTPRPLVGLGSAILSTETASLMGYWPCDDVAGATYLEDRSGKGHHLAPIPGGALPDLQQPGLRGPAVRGGVNKGAYINANLTGLSSAGVYWYNQPSTGWTLWGIFKDLRGQSWSGSTGSIATVAQVSDSLAFNNWSGLRIGSGTLRMGGQYSDVSLPSQINDRIWHTYAVVMDSALASNGIALYIDNNRVGTFNAYAGTTWAPDFFFLLGNQYGGFNGSAQHVATWSVPLSNSELTRLQAEAATVPDVTPPVSGASSISNSGTTVNLTVTDNASYPLHLDGSPAGFTVTADGAPVVISNVSIDPNDETNLLITLAAPIKSWQLVRLSYSGTGVSDRAGNLLPAITNQYTQNYSTVTNPLIPTVTSHSWVIPHTTEGWTNLDVIWSHARANGAKKIYVSNSGSDSNSGLDMTAAVATIARASVLASPGDWILLRSGDTWNESPNLTNGGTSPNVLGLFGAYSDGSSNTRPVLRQSINVQSSYLVVDGIKVDLSWRVNEDVEGFNALGNFKYVIAEDLWLDNAHDAGNIQGVSHFYIHRTSATNSHAATAHSQGFYIGTSSYITIDDCLLDHNGWTTPGTSTMFNHNVYLQYDNLPGTTDFTNNISARASSHGIQNRSGGVNDGNLFLHNALTAFIGLTGSMRDNVTMGSRRNDTNGVGGFGLLLNGVAKSARFPYIEMSGNLVLHNDTSYVWGTALEVADFGGLDHITGLDTSVQDIRIHDNVVYDWTGTALGINAKSALATFTNLQVQNNLFDQTAHASYGQLVFTQFARSYQTQSWGSNRYFGSSATTDARFSILSTYMNWGAWSSTIQEVGSTYATASPRYVDPNRSMATYMASIGQSGGEEEFLAARALMSRTSGWDSRYTAAAVNAYMQAGFRTTP